MWTNKQKQIFQKLSLVFVIAIATVLTSCTFTEKIYVEEDGSGTYEIDSDMSGAMSFMSGFADGLSADSTQEDSKANTMNQYLDTVINFNDVLLSLEEEGEEITEEKKAVLESLKDAKMKSLIDMENGKMLMTFMYDFNKITDLKDVQKKASSAYKMSGKDDMSFTSPSSTSYEYTSNSFKRIVVSNKLSKKEKKEYDETMDQMKMFFTGSSYKIEYHFPNKIKNTTAKNATFSEDKKTMYITYPFDELLKDESVLNFEVKF